LALSVIGDVLVQAKSSVTIVDSRIETEKAMNLPSVHGSMSHMEMDIPCLVDIA
ncbi:nucleotide pyrophosphatase, partial [Gardnerella vaginalis]